MLFELVRWKRLLLVRVTRMSGGVDLAFSWEGNNSVYLESRKGASGGKFWRAWVCGTEVFSHFGRLGKRGQGRPIGRFASEAEAQQALDLAIHKKTRPGKGYVLANDPGRVEQSAPAKKKAPVKKKSKEPAKTTKAKATATATAAAATPKKKAKAKAKRKGGRGVPRVPRVMLVTLEQ